MNDGRTLREFNREAYSEDELQRIRRILIPMRWLVTKLFSGQKVRNETHLYVEFNELDLPDGFKVCGAHLSPGGFGIEVYVTHPSFEPTPIHLPIPDLHDGPLFRLVSLRLADPQTPQEKETIEKALGYELEKVPTPEANQDKPHVPEITGLPTVDAMLERRRQEYLQRAKLAGGTVAKAAEDKVLGLRPSQFGYPDSYAKYVHEPIDPGVRRVSEQIEKMMIGVDPSLASEKCDGNCFPGGPCSCPQPTGEITTTVTRLEDEPVEEPTSTNTLRLSNKRSFLPKELQ